MAESRVKEHMLVVVGSANARGIKPQGGSEYINWSQYAPLKEDQRPVPSRGQTVKLGLDEKGFIQEMLDQSGNPLGGNGASGAGGQASLPFTADDQRRITLLSCLRSAAILLANQEPPDGVKMSDAAIKIARAWAREVDPSLFKDESRGGATT